MTTLSASFFTPSLSHFSHSSPPFAFPIVSSSASETMKNCEKSQILMLTLIVVLLIVTPLLSSSARTTYLYIITNLLIIALGAQAGIFRAFSKPIDHHEKKDQVSVPQRPSPVVPSESESGKNIAALEISEKDVPNKVVAKSKSQKVTGTAKIASLRKCPSMPSLFFIGGGEAETNEEAHSDDDEDFLEELHQIEEEKEEEVADLSGQELLIKAEKFIGNFYKQLKMQREESWNKIHGMYQKAF